jgi:hypothetical protein
MSADYAFCKLPLGRIWLATEHALVFPDSFRSVKRIAPVGHVFKPHE